MKESAFRIALIGGGNMGEAMLGAILGKGLSVPEAVRVSDVAENRRWHLKQKFGIVGVESNPEALPGSEVIILAVKPQSLAAVAVELNGRFRPDQLVMSIVAGVSIGTLSRGLAHDSVVRVMPNTPAQIGEGMSVWTASPLVNDRQKQRVASILGAMGSEIYVQDESYIDMATAISGSGPAYVFLFMESLIAAGEAIGIPGDMAKQLVLRTVLGAARYAEKSGRPLADLRRMVTSPGGTTAEALAQFEQGKFSELVLAAVRAAHEKAKRLGK